MKIPSSRASIRGASILLAGVALAGCNLVVGIQPFREGEPVPEEGAGGASVAACGWEDPAKSVYSHAWSAVYGQVYDAVAVASFEGGVFMSGGTPGGSTNLGGDPIDADGYLVKIDADGKHKWSKGVPTSTRRIAGGSGKVAISGLTSNAVDFGSGPVASGPFGASAVAVYGDDGGYLWSRVFTYGPDGGYANEIWSLAMGSDGSLFMAGYFYKMIDFGGGPISAPDGHATFLAKFDYAGTVLWSKIYGSGSGTVPAIAIDNFGNVILKGGYAPMLDFGGGPLIGGGDSDNVYFVKLDTNGAHIWSRLIGAPGSLFTSDGNVYIVGNVTEKSVDAGGGPLTSVGGSDIYLAKYDGGGKLIFTKTFGDIGDQVVTAVSGSYLGSVLLTGSFEGIFNIGDCKLASSGGQDLFIARLNGDGDVVFGKRYSVENMGGFAAIGSDYTDSVLVAGVVNDAALDLGGGPINNQGLFAGKLTPPVMQ